MSAHEHDTEHCRDLLERLSEYIDGEAPPSVCDEIEKHLASCEPCVRFIRSLRSTVAHVGRVPRPEMSEEMKRACIDAYEKRRGDTDR